MIDQKIILDYFGLPYSYESQAEFVSFTSFMSNIHEHLLDASEISEAAKETFGEKLLELEGHEAYDELIKTDSVYALILIDKKYDLKNFDYLSSDNISTLSISDKDKLSVYRAKHIILKSKEKNEKEDGGEYFLELIGALILYPFIALVFVTLFLPYYRIELLEDYNLGIGLSPYDILMGAKTFANILPDEAIKLILVPLLIWISLLSLIGGIISKQGEHILAGILVYLLAGGLATKFTEISMMGLGGKINAVSFGISCFLLLIAIIIVSIMEWFHDRNSDKKSLYKKFEKRFKK
jgi:hypothetical protein